MSEKASHFNEREPCHPDPPKAEKGLAGRRLPTTRFFVGLRPSQNDTSGLRSETS